MRGVVPVVQDGAALVGAENVESADRPLGIGNGRLEQSNEAARHRFHAGAIEQISRVFERSIDPRRRAVR